MKDINLTEGTKQFLSKNKQALDQFKDMTITEQREAIRAMNADRHIDQYEGEEWKIEWNERIVPIRIYRPNIEDHAPVIVYFHGGGWVLGDIESRDSFCRRMTEFTQCVVIAVDYKLSPDYTFPEAINDGLAIVEWLLADEFRLWSLLKIVVAGDGAGANITLGIVNRFNSNNPTIPIFQQILICPVINLSSFETDSYKQFGKGLFLEKWMMETYKYCYITEEVEETDPLVSPYYIKNYQHIPPTTLITAEYDILHDEGKDFALKLVENGVSVDYHNFDRMIHGFLGLTDIDAEAEKAVLKLLIIIKSNIG